MAESDPDADPFKPPTISTLVSCLHCGEEFDSYLIEWRIEKTHDGKQHGFWCCPTPKCDGKGFGFDIFPLDPEYVDEEGNKMWCSDEGEDDDGEWIEESNEDESSEGKNRDDEDDEAIPF